MSFVSYAQNFEDVILYRALKHIEKGFYLDVGANDPVIDSVTKAFYERGWKGVNIDPSPISYAKLIAARPRDTNLNIAVGPAKGSLTFYDVAVSGWSTLDKTVAMSHKANGTKVEEREVEVRTLIDICQEYAPQEIHFLKIDVEGAEDLVFAGMSFDTFRPWIVVVEATLPNSAQLSECLWEAQLLDSGYRFVYFDGLNRFYVAHEHSELSDVFHLPPNVFDDFVLYRIDELTRELEFQEEQVRRIRAEAQAQIHAANTSAHEAHVSAHEAHVSAQQAHLMIQAMKNSISWKITLPLRMIKMGIHDPKGLIKKIFLKLGRYALGNPKMLKIIRKIISLSPRLSAFAYRIAAQGGLITAAEIIPVSLEKRLLGEEGRDVLSKIERQITKRGNK